MKLYKGQKLDSGFSVIDVVNLDEMQATGIWAKHEKCGVEVFHVMNNDSENLFAFAFATTPEDNTGAAHILEHSVLCGSERYPLKDAFLVLAQGSLQTFLNAWTFPDKTVYPASSVNEHDYFNLMSVYGDAVFRPLLSEWTFMQEGHRHEFSDGRLSITGVVYNEMKGAYSSQDTYAGLWSVKAVLPDTPYSFESGGDPESIPALSWEGLKDFHRRRYAPANCRIFLAGNIPTEKQLAFLNEQFFASMDADTVKPPALPPIPKQKRWNEPRRLAVSCPAGGDASPMVFVSWLCAGALDTGDNFALAALTEILLGHDGSPLMRTLLESGLGEDIAPVSGLEAELGESLFVAGLRGVSAGTDAGAVETLILDELRRLAREGIPPEEVEAALLFMEFSQREIKRSGGPYSLVWMRRSLRAWLHGSTPWESLLVTPQMEELKRRLSENNHYFESLIEKYLLDNPHRALVTLEPREDFLPGQEARLAETLTKTENSLSEKDRDRIIEKSTTLERIQSEGDSPEALAAIPHLSRSDLSPEPEMIPRSLEDLGGIPALCHDLHTNGISYIDLAFPLDILPPEDYHWLPFFTRAALAVGLPGMDYGEVSTLVARTVGGFNAILHTGSAAQAMTDTAGTEQFDLAGRDWIIYRLKCLDEKTADSVALARRLITQADFTDHRRIRDLVLEMRNEIRSSLAPMGHSYASCRAGRYASYSTQTVEIWNGISQLEFVHRLAEMDTAELAAKLHYLREAVVSGGLMVNLTGSAAALKNSGVLLSRQFSGFGPPRPRGELLSSKQMSVSSGPEVFASPALQVGFAAVSLRAAAFDTPAQLAETVLAHQLSTGALWEDIRMKGGAYGAFASSDSLEGNFSLATYRDPNPLRSLDSFSAILKSSRPEDFMGEDELVKSIIGCYARETRPRTPVEKGVADFLRFISRIDNGYRHRRLARLIAVSVADIGAGLEALASQLARQDIAGQVIIAGAKDAEQAAKALGTDVQVLPV